MIVTVLFYNSYLRDLHDRDRRFIYFSRATSPKIARLFFKITSCTISCNHFIVTQTICLMAPFVVRCYSCKPHGSLSLCSPSLSLLMPLLSPPPLSLCPCLCSPPSLSVHLFNLRGEPSCLVLLGPAWSRYQGTPGSAPASPQLLEGRAFLGRWLPCGPRARRSYMYG